MNQTLTLEPRVRFRLRQNLVRGAVATVATVAVVTGLFITTAAEASTTVPHRSGGVSVEEFTELKAQSADYSLRLLLAASGSGAYLSDVEVTVRSLATRDLVLEHRTEGPLLLAALPPGRYEVTASFAGVLDGAPDTVTRILTIPAGGFAKTVMYFDTGDTLAPDSPAEFRLR